MPTQTSDILQFNPSAAPAPSRARLSVGGIFSIMVALVVATAAATFWVNQLSIRFERSMLQLHETIDAVDSVLASVRDAETAQRGYLLTGIQDYLTPYERTVKTLPSQLDDLDSRARAGLLAQPDVDSIRRLAEQEMAELDRTISLRRNAGELAAPLVEVRSDAGKLNLDNMQTLVHRIVMQKESDVVRFESDSENIGDIRAAVFGGTAVIKVAFLLWAYKRIKREMRGRTQAAERLAGQRQFTAVTLASIADGIIVTDEAGDILFMNQMAERLTGWPAADALGRSCAFVLRIVDETTHKPVPNPLERILHAGAAPAKSRHALLIRRDGSQMPIDDSGAPIHNEDGQICGVVLVFRDFSEQKRFETNLQKAKEDAESANIAKDNFLAVLSHELRTPLTPVLASLTAWEEYPTLPPELQEQIVSLRRCIQLEARLIDDLLDLTRIVRGKFTLHFEVVDVHELIESVDEMYRSEISGKDIRVRRRLTAASRHVSADSGRLQQVFWNILKNAVKFTPRGGTIDIASANTPDGKLQITFTDSGEGIASEALAKIFQPFEQGSAEIVRRYGGLGLGLSLSKAFIEAQGGTIAASSPGLGNGSSFTICMPVVPAPERKSQTPAQPKSAAASERHLEILLVEDHDDTSRVLARLLERLGHRVRRADSVASALAAANLPFDLLLSDIGLPDGTGIELIHQLRNDYHLEVPAVALTGFGMEEDIAKTRDAGFTEHLTKPINFQRLQMVVQRIADAKVVTAPELQPSFSRADPIKSLPR